LGDLGKNKGSLPTTHRENLTRSKKCGGRGEKFKVVETFYKKKYPKGVTIMKARVKEKENLLKKGKRPKIRPTPIILPWKSKRTKGVDVD